MNITDPSKLKRKLLFYVDVDVGKGKKGRIGVHEGDHI